MMTRCFLPLLLGILCAGRIEADPAAFRDNFTSSLQEGWSWVREDPEGWRLKDGGLEIQSRPGNLWGPANDAKNVLVRPAPDPGETPVEVSVIAENRPTAQYEQANLVWYYDDSHMVKLGQELVNGDLSIVMGREESDRTRTIAIIPIESHRVQLRLRVDADRVHGQFRALPGGEWTDVGNCELPVQGKPQVSLHTYQGPGQGERWVRFTDFQIRPLLQAD